MRSFGHLRMVLTLAISLLVVGVHVQLQAQEAFWVPTNSPTGTTVGFVRSSPTGILYMIAGATYRSSDDGDSWHVQTVPVGFNTVYFISEDTILAGSNSGVYRSTDSGNNWTLVTVSNLVVRCFERDAIGNIILGSGVSGVYRSTDRGQTWAWLGLHGIAINAIGLDSSDNLYATSEYGRAFRSGNNGLGWSEITISGSTQARLFITAADHGVIVGTSDGLYRSTDGGRNWLALPAPRSQVSGIVRSIAGHLFVGFTSGDVRKSTDNGVSWDSVGPGPGQRIRAIAAGRSSFLFLGTDLLGVFRSTDQGASWQARNRGLPYILLEKLAAGVGGEVLGGTARYFAYLTLDSGMTWSKSWPAGFFFTTITDVAIHPAGTYFVGTFTAGAEGFYTYGAYRSTNRGMFWENYASGRNGGALRIAIGSDGVIFQGLAGSVIIRSTDGGFTWSPASPGTGSTNALHVSRFNNRIFASLAGRGIFLSADNGNSWTQTNIDGAFGPLATTPSGFLLAGHGPSGLFRSADNGTNWSSSPLINMSVRSIVVNSVGHVFAASDQGVFHSTDYGSLWNRLNDGLLDSNIVALALDSVGFLYASTSASGVYRSQSPTVTSGPRLYVEGPTMFQLSQNYPNPFNPNTAISYDIPRTSHVRLDVFDVLGGKVATLVNEVKEPGTHTLTWDGRGVASGVYFYRLAAGSFTQTRKLLLLR